MHGVIPPPQYLFMTWCLVKHRDYFTSPRLRGNNLETHTILCICSFCLAWNIYDMPGLGHCLLVYCWHVFMKDV